MLDARGGSPRPGRLRRGSGHAARALVWGLVFVASTLLGVLLHGNVPALRQSAIEIANRALEGKFRGRLALGELEHLSPSRATLSRLELWDEHGASVLLLEGVHLRYRPWPLLLGWLTGSDAPLRFEHVRVERSRVALRSDAETQAWSLARALQSPRPPSTRRPRPPVHYAFEAVELGEVAVSIEHPSIGQLEATIHHLQGSAELEGADASIALQRFGLRLVAAGDVALDGTGSLRLLPHGYAAGTFHGLVDGTELDLALELDGDQLAARVDVPHALPEHLQRRWPAWPLKSALTAHVTARGPVRAPHVDAHLEAGTSRVDASGELQFGAALRAQLDVQAHALDARLLWPEAPATQLEAHATLELERATSGLLVRAQGTSEPGRIAGFELPQTRFSLRVDPERASGTLEAESPRGQLRAEIQSVTPGTAHLDLHARRVDLRAWPELRGSLAGALELEAHADLQQQRLSGTVQGTAAQLQIGSVEVARTRVRGGWSGSIGDWDGFEIETSLLADGLRWGSASFERGSWTSHGKWSRSRFDAELSATNGSHQRAHGVLELGAEGVTLRDLDASWSERELQLSARASLLSPARRVLHVERFQISGAAGKLRGAVRFNPGAVDATLDAEALDTGRLSRSFGGANLGHTGKLTGHAELSTDARATRGNVDLELLDLTVRDLAIGNLDLRATLQDRRVELNLSSSRSPLGRLEARATGTLAGSVLEPRSWQRATGDGTVTLKQLPLWPVGLLLPQRGALQNLAGQLELALQLERRSAQELPSVFFQASTQELSFSLNTSRDAKVEPTTFDRFALHASASLDGTSGHGAATVLVTDEKGALVTTSGSVALDLARLLANPAAVLEQLLHTPLDVLMRLHARPLSQLPAPLSVPDLAGSVEATLQLAGTLAEPTLDLAVEGRGLLGSSASGSEALAVSGLVHYVPGSGELTGRAQATRAGSSLVSARLEGRVREQTGEAAGPFALAGWELGEVRAAAMLNGVPLELWPAAAREHFQAKLYGSVAVERHGSELRPSAYVEIGALSVNGHALGSGHFKLETEDAATRAEFDLGPVEHRLRAQLEARPGSAGVEGSLTATDFAVASLSPFVSDILSHLGGTLDANATFQLQRKPDAGYYLGINGHAELKAASLQLDLLGLQVKDLSATLRARSTPDHTVILIDPVQGKSRSRKTNVEADAELWMEGVRLVSGEARVSLNDVPLSLKSALRGTARGRLEGRLERKPDFMALQVKVPQLRLALPASTTRSLIALDANPDFHLGELSEPAPPRASDALLWKIDFALGNSVQVERADLSLPLTGDPQLEFRDELRPSGSIELRPGGRITLFDQNFSVDHGVLTFDPDAAENPRVDVTASWRAPDGTTVYVDVTGRAQEASVLTRDDRGLQDIDRFYLLTGNSTAMASSGAANSSESGLNDRAALGQTFSLGINQLLRKSVGNVAVSVDTSADDRASYSASVRLSDRLSFQGSFRPPSETNREESTDLTGTLDYQISRRWSLRTELGTTGGAFDLLWSHRY